MHDITVGRGDTVMVPFTMTTGLQPGTLEPWFAGRAHFRAANTGLGIHRAPTPMLTPHRMAPTSLDPMPHRRLLTPTALPRYNL